jgi:clan AA aspartic protease (TIGR02281 family)
MESKMDKHSKTPGDQGVPFRLSKAIPLIIVQAVVNGKGPFNFVVDTGASMTVISPAVAKRAGVTFAQTRAIATGADGHMKASIARLKSLVIGAAGVKDLQVAVISLAVLNRSTRLKLGGIVGYNVLRRYRVTIDYGEKRILLRPISPRKAGLPSPQRRRGRNPAQTRSR